MSFRFVDLDRKTSPYKDFIIRRRAPTMIEQFFICLVLILAGIAVLSLINDRLYETAILFTILGAAAVYVTSQTNRNRNHLEATELQNAIFASALTRDCAFCLIVRQGGGDILYHNREFDTLFPDAGRQAADWLASAHATPETAARIGESIHLGKEENVPFTLESGSRQWLLSIEAIRRPAGFMLLRGRDPRAGQ